MAFESSFALVPCHKKEKGSQKCYVSIEVFSKIGGILGCPCKVQLCDDTSLLCNIYLHSGINKDIVSADTLVVKQKLLTDYDVTYAKSYVKNISVFERHSAQTVEVDVVMSDILDVSTMNKVSAYANRIRRTVKQLLYCLTLHEGYHVNCDALKLGSLCGVKRILVMKTNPSQQCVVVSPNTDVEIKSIFGWERFHQLHSQRYMPVLAGIDLPFMKLDELLSCHCNVSSNNKGPLPRTVLLRGPPGCGKSSIVQVVASKHQAYLLKIAGSEIIGSRPGESEANLKDIFNKAIRNSEEGPCVLFIDEIDAICSKDKGAAEDRLVSQLCCLIDMLQQHSGPLLFVTATNQPSAIPVALRRPGRLDREIFIGIPSMNDRCEILSSLTSDLDLVDVNINSLAERTPGYVGADLMSLVQHAVHSAITQSNDANNEKVQVHQKHFISALHMISPSTQRGSDVTVDHRPVEWQDVGGLDDVKHVIKQAIEWPLKHPNAFLRLGIPRPTGVLLYGPPGCAKTTLVRAAATACHVTFLSVSGAQLYSPYVGDSERKISEVFSQARAGAPAVLFLDEIDSVMGARGGGGVRDRVLAALLTEMDGVGIRCDDLSSTRNLKICEGQNEVSQKSALRTEMVNNTGVLVVAATNRPDNLDAALLRPGRLDKHIYVPPPDLQARIEILRVHSRKTPLEGVDFEVIAEKTENFTGADIENLCREAALLALSESQMKASHVCQKHFEQALKHVSPTLSPQDILKYKAMLQEKR